MINCRMWRFYLRYTFLALIITPPTNGFAHYTNPHTRIYMALTIQIEHWIFRNVISAYRTSNKLKALA